MFTTLPLALFLLPLVSADIFTLTASLTGSPLDGQTVQANGQALYLGLSGPSEYCPVQQGVVCPTPTGKTAFTEGLEAMWVEVPGGQSTYVTTTGAIGYAMPHSISIPTGAIVGGWFNLTFVGDCDLKPSKTVYNWIDVNTGSEGVLACPVAANSNLNATYQIFARTIGFSQTGCTELDGLLPGTWADPGQFGAWEY